MILAGIDNGSSGSVCIIDSHGKPYFHKTPVKSTKNYQTGKDTYITRVDVVKLKELFMQFYQKGDTYALLERPLNNPMMYKASMSAMRALEATLIVLEEFLIPYEFIDSKNWQKVYLGADIKGKENLKARSKELGQLVFPEIQNADFDSYFIALYLKDNFDKIFQIKK